MAEEKLMTEKEWKEKQTRKTRKKHIRNALALVLVAVISVVGTLAYLSKKTGPTTNTFTGSAGLKLGLTEPNWEGDDGDSSKANGYTPNQVLKKDPILYNGSSVTLDGTYPNKNATVTKDDNYDYEEYVAIRIDFTNGKNNAITYSALLNVIKPINFDTTNWKLVKLLKDKDDGTGTEWKDIASSDTLGSTNTDGAITSPQGDINNAKSMIFVYKKTDLTQLTAGGKTAALFSQIQIRKGNSSEPIQLLDGTLNGVDDANLTSDKKSMSGGFPDFNIVVEGAAVDTGSYGGTTNHLVTDAETDLINLLTSK